MTRGSTSSTLFPYTTLFRSEAGLREVARIEVERRVGEKIDSLADSRIAGFARQALGRVDADIAQRGDALRRDLPAQVAKDRKSTRLNSSHGYISYAVFCLTK